MATQSIGEEAASNPGMAINMEADNQPKVELQGNGGGYIPEQWLICGWAYYCGIIFSKPSTNLEATRVEDGIYSSLGQSIDGRLPCCQSATLCLPEHGHAVRFRLA